MELDEKLKELNKELNSNITYTVGFDSMYQKNTSEWRDDNGEIFFKAMSSERVADTEDWKINTLNTVKHRYIELYKK